MCKVTSKLQVTVPKAIAKRYGIRPGDEIRFEEAGEVIRVVPDEACTQSDGLDIETRLRLFDAATAWQRAREGVTALGAPMRTGPSPRRSIGLSGPSEAADTTAPTPHRTVATRADAAARSGCGTASPGTRRAPTPSHTAPHSVPAGR